MTTPRDPDSIVAAWLDEGPTRLPEGTRRAILVSTRTSQQKRHRMWVPWRTSSMNPLARVAVAATAVVIVVVGVVGLNPFGAGPGAGSAPSPTPTATTAPVSPTPTSQPSPSPLDISTWVTYTSARYGFSIGHPTDWTERPADHDWTFAADTDWLTTASEGFRAPAQTILVTAWSVSVAPGTSIEKWLQAYCPKNTTPCARQDRAVVVTVDGYPGILVPFKDDTQAFILIDDRMYVVAVWEPDSDPRTAPYGGARRLLEAYVSTLHLLPGGPAPASSAPPPASSPAPS